MASFEALAAQPAATAVPEAKVSVADIQAEVQRVKDAAVQRGHAEGYAHGHAQGLEEGTRQGLASGHKQGYEEGLRAGHAAAQELGQKEARRLAGLADAGAASLHAMEAEIGQSLIALAIGIAEHVLHTHLESNPEALLEIVRGVLRMQSDADAPLRLRVHPDDHDLVARYLTDDMTSTRWRAVADATVSRGGCIAETALGTIDATLQTRWRRAVATLGHPDTMARTRA